MKKFAFQQSIFLSKNNVKIAPYAQVTFKNASDNTAASVWSDEDGLDLLDSNTVLANENGYILVYLTLGFYNIDILSGSDTATLTNVFVGGASYLEYETFADIPVFNSPTFVLIDVDETNNNDQTLYFYDGANLNWIPMVGV